MCGFYSDYLKVKKNGGNKETEFFDFLEQKSIKSIDKDFFAKDQFMRHLKEFYSDSEDLDALDDLILFFTWCSKKKDIKENQISERNLSKAIDKLTYQLESEKYEELASSIKVKKKDR